MKTYGRKSRWVILMIVILVSIQACNKADLKKSEETSYNADKTISENIANLNVLLEARYGKTMKVLNLAEYEESGQSEWVLIVENEKVSIDTATWKYEYDPDSEESIYMDAILTTFIFFYDEEMGKALWQLAGDLVDGGADERQYGFTHEGGKAIFKNGDTAIFEAGKNNNFYLRLVPDGVE